MTNIIQNIQELTARLNAFVDNICKPNSKYSKSKVEQEIHHNRIKAVFMCHVVFILFLTAQIFMNPDEVRTNVIVILGNILFSSCLLSLKTYHPEIVKIIYNILVSAVVLVLKDNNEDGIHRIWMMMPVYPTLVFWFTGSVRHLCIQSGIQLIWLETIYKPQMIQSILFRSPEDLVESFAINSSKAVIFIVIIIIFIQRYLQNANDRVFAAEKTKMEFEGQKTFLLGFSHELRNLLNSLMGNIKLASLEQLNDKTKEFLDNANLCGELLLHLVNNILDTGKNEIGDLEVNPVSANIIEILEKIWNVSSEVIRRKNLNGTLRIKKNIPTMLKVDHYRLTQILLNLVGNAVKFTDLGSVDISVEWINNVEKVEERCFEPNPFNDSNEFSEGIFEKDRCFSVFDREVVSLDLKTKKFGVSQFSHSMHRTQGILKIAVNDSGCGILAKDLEKLFQKFAQVNSDSSRRKLGTGLGLFITKQICEKMNGEIKVFSKIGKGSCFVICIPVETVIPSNIRQPSRNRNRTQSIEQLKGLKALVVDDENLSSIVLTAFLTKLGVDVIDVGHNGLEGYDKYLAHTNRNNQPQIVVMDIEMPIMDGKKSAEQIRELEHQKELTPCLLLIISGNCSASEIAECMDVHGKVRANAFLKKPAGIEEICQVLLDHFNEQLEL